TVSSSPSSHFGIISGHVSHTDVLIHTRRHINTHIHNNRFHLELNTRIALQSLTNDVLGVQCCAVKKHLLTQLCFWQESCSGGCSRETPPPPSPPPRPSIYHARDL